MREQTPGKNKDWARSVHNSHMAFVPSFFFERRQRPSCGIRAQRSDFGKNLKKDLAHHGLRAPVTSTGRNCCLTCCPETPLSTNVYRPPHTLLPPVTPGPPSPEVRIFLPREFPDQPI